MYRDTTSIVLPETDACAYIYDDKTIILQNSSVDTEQTYALISDKYTQISERSFTGDLTTEYICLTDEQLTTIPSYYDFMTPVYHLMAIASAIIIFWFAWKLIVYPWYRKKA